MPFGYLVTVAILAGCTLFALAPPRPRHSSPSNIGFWFGYLLNELPLIALYWLLASTVLALAQGDIGSSWGWGVFSLAVLVAIGVGVVAWRGLQARPVVERALNEGLGTGWGEVVNATIRTRKNRTRTARFLLAPFFYRHRDVRRVANVRYGAEGKYNLLDIYHHRSRPSGSPTLVFLHGGAFRSGNKSREALPLLYRLASQGWVCISANYRLSPAATFPDHLIDVKKVIAWVRENGKVHGANPDVLFVAGSSAGGHLASTAALTQNLPAYQPGFENVDTSITAVISLYGYYGSIASRDGIPSSPLEYLKPNAPPFFIAHGDLDTIVLVEDARAFVERLRNSSASPVVYAELPGAQHVFDLFHSFRFEAVVDGIEAFASWVRSNNESPPAP